MKRKSTLIAAAAFAGLCADLARAQEPPMVNPPIPGSQGMPLPGPAGDRRRAADEGATAPEGQPPAPGGVPAPGAPPAQPLETLRPPPDAGENKVVHDQAYRARAVKDYKRAASLFEKLAGAQLEILDYRLNLALSLYELGKLKESAEIYDRVLAAEPDNIQALIATARIFCKTASAERDPPKKAQLLDNAKEQLRRAARNGANGLRAVKSFPEFGDFKNDVVLQLEIIAEPQSFRFEGPSGRDPFYNPLPTRYDKESGLGAGAGGGDERTRLSGPEQESLVKRFEQLFAEIEPLVEKSDFEGLGRKWAEIDEIIRQETKISSIDLLPKFKDLMKRHREKLPVVRSLLLRSYYTEGERIIEGMKTEYDRQDHQKVAELWNRLEMHAKKMVTTDERFAQPASDLLGKGKPIYDRAMTLKEIEQIKIAVTAIVYTGGASQAIVNNRILAEGDIVYDSGGNPIPELRVVQIKRRRVRFEYKGLQFEPRNQLVASR